MSASFVCQQILVIFATVNPDHQIMAYMNKTLHLVAAAALFAAPCNATVSYLSADDTEASSSSVYHGAYKSQQASEVEPTVTLTFAEGTSVAKIGVGGSGDYEFSIDWGDGEPVSYNAQDYYTHAVNGNPVKIYGDEIIVFQATSQNILTADFSRASQLIRIMVGGNGMTELTLGSHPQLTGLYAEENNIGHIDVEGCPALKVLDLHINQIANAIDCSSMSELSKLDIADNLVPSVTLPKQSIMYDIDVDNNLLETLDVTGLSGLDELNASGNRLSSLDLTGLDALVTLRAGSNRLTTVDISPCANLETVMLAENEIETIDFSRNQSLSGIYLQDNAIESLDITANASARWVNISNNGLTGLDVSGQPYLSLLNLSGNDIAAIDLASNTSLSSLDLSDNALTEVDVTNAGYLSQLYLEKNSIRTLDLSGNPYLYGLFIGENEISELDLSKNTYLQRLEAQENKLATLDITSNTGLQSIYIQDNLFDAGALNSFIESLPDVSSVQVTEQAPFLRQLDISNMPGTEATDIAPAEAKGWYVTAEYNSSGIEAANCGDNVKSVRYFNTLGIASDRPHDGVNIVVTSYTDGTKETAKTTF